VEDFGDSIEKWKGRLCLHPITHRSSHADPSFDLDGNRRVAAGSNLFFAGHQDLQTRNQAGVWAPPELSGAPFGRLPYIKSGNPLFCYRIFGDF
jgi:hypothetical protein